MVERGWQAIKVKIGRHVHPRVDVERLRAVRDAIGPNTWLSVDANGGYTVEQAVWVAPRLEKLDVSEDLPEPDPSPSSAEGRG